MCAVQQEEGDTKTWLFLLAQYMGGPLRYATTMIQIMVIQKQVIRYLPYWSGLFKQLSGVTRLAALHSVYYKFIAIESSFHILRLI